MGRPTRPAQPSPRRKVAQMTKPVDAIRAPVYTQALMTKITDYLTPKEKTKMVTLRVPLDLLKAAQAKAKREKVTLTDVLLAGLKLFVDGK